MTFQTEKSMISRSTVRKIKERSKQPMDHSTSIEPNSFNAIKQNQPCKQSGVIMSENCELEGSSHENLKGIRAE